MSKFVKYNLCVIEPAQATGLVKRIYRQMNQENAGVHGPFLIHSSVPNLLAGIWALFRETQIASTVPRVDLETIALVIAEQNQCPWCIEAHSTALANTSQNQEIAQWAKAAQNPDDPALKNPPFKPEQMSEYVAVVLLWQYINRMSNALLIDSAWVAFGQFKQPYLKLMSWVFEKFVLTKPNKAGLSLEFLETHDLPKHLEFMQNTNIAAALSHLHHTLQTAIDTALPVTVQIFALQKIKEWRGQHMGLSRQWVNEMVKDLSDEHQASAKLVLLTAFAAYQLEQGIVDQYRKYYPDNAALLTATAWASYHAATRVAGWVKI